jgi:hypothetical protein
LSEYFTRTAIAAAVVAASVLIHLGLLGLIVMAERRSLAKSETQVVEVELVKPEEQPVKEEEPPLRENSPPEPKQQQSKSSKKSAKVSLPEPQTAEPPPPPENDEKPDIPSGGPPSETKAKLTAEEIAAFRAEIQKCWELMVGVPDAMKLEVVLRVGLTRKGALAGSPDLLKAPASVHGPRLVGIAMKAMQQCGPYKSLPAAKYNEWKVLDLRFLATGMAGLDTTRIDVSKLPRG